MERRGDPDDVGNGVQCADLMKMNLIFPKVVDFGFCFGQSPEAG